MNKKLLCLIWIVSVLVIGGLLWFFTRSFRMRLLAEEVNKVLAQNGGGQIEAATVFPGGPSSVLTGTWFVFHNDGDSSGGGTAAAIDRAFAFTLIRNGISAACVALVDKDGKVRTIIPLGGNARQITEELPRPLYRFYAGRIEEAARNRIVKAGGLR